MPTEEEEAMKWLRYRHEGRTAFGTLEGGDRVREHQGSPFEPSAPGGQTLALADVELLAPCVPGKIVGLWNNFRAAAEKNQWAVPAEPLYFLKSPGSAIGHGQPIAVPAAYDGRVAYEGELAVIIGRRCRAVPREEAPTHIFGYCGANDVTALELLNRDPAFPQWTRAKSFDGFGAFGPWIDTDFNPAGARLRTLVGGRERQNYPLDDMFFGPAELVSRISHDMTLEPGDVILCGTSLGVLPMKPGTTVEVVIDGLAPLVNTYG
jgi:2-keto-4-pentenoate hydratase/2-oxohepta-3-ene-1,7-dioic acid hydratase in catechol pathway